uniref:Peroxisomal membrane protein PMP34-like n=1 Tax=Sinocyclocheilus grahami TaxID=75366 RepID=A0A672KK45_SINGR
QMVQESYFQLVTAMTVFFPLDTARLRLQVDDKRKTKSSPAILSEIIKEEGLLAPYRGWFPVICSLCCSNFVYFYCFHSLKATWLQGQRSTPGRDLIIGIAAGVVNVLVTTPLWVVNTRLKLQGAKFRNEDIQPTHYKGITDAFVQIMQQEGVGALWNGTFPSLLLVLNPAVQFMIYEGLKRQLMTGVHREVSSIHKFSVAWETVTTAFLILKSMQMMISIHVQASGEYE